MPQRNVIVVDGANVAYAERTKQGKPKVSNLVAVRRALEQRGYEPIIIADASLRYEVDDPDQLETLIDSQVIRQVPAETDADYFVLETAEQQNAPVVSNDQFEPYRDKYLWIDQRRVPLMIVEGQVEVYEPKLKSM